MCRKWSVATWVTMMSQFCFVILLWLFFLQITTLLSKQVSLLLFYQWFKKDNLLITIKCKKVDMHPYHSNKYDIIIIVGKFVEPLLVLLVFLLSSYSLRILRTPATMIRLHFCFIRQRWESFKMLPVRFWLFKVSSWKKKPNIHHTMKIIILIFCCSSLKKTKKCYVFMFHPIVASLKIINSTAAITNE